MPGFRRYSTPAIAAACLLIATIGAAEAVVEVPLTGNAALTDIDTPEAFEAVKAELEGT